MNTAVATATPTLRAQAQRWWQERGKRERQALVLAGAVLGLFLGWRTLVQPALDVLRSAPPQLDALELQLQQTQRASTETARLRGTPRIAPAQALQALKAATERLGERGRLVPQGERAVLTLTDVPPEALRAWLAEARSGARARAIEAQLQRSPQGLSGSLTVLLGGTP